MTGRVIYKSFVLGIKKNQCSHDLFAVSQSLDLLVNWLHRNFSLDFLINLVSWRKNDVNVMLC